MSDITIDQARIMFLDSIKLPRSANTLRGYSSALKNFSDMFESQQVDTKKFLVAELTEASLTHFIFYMKGLSPSTEKLYLQVIKNFYEFLVSEHLAIVNLSRVRMLIR